MRGWASSLIGGILLAGLVPAQAFAYRTASDLEEFAGSAAVRWPDGVVPISLHDRMPAGVSTSEAEAALNRARRAWTVPECTALGFRYQGVTSTRARSGDGRATAEWVLSRWTDRGFSPDAAATTDVLYARQPDGSFAIVDADVYLNAQHFRWHVGASDGDGRRDAEAVLTHELGHVAGLLHPCAADGSEEGPPCDASFADATMYPVYLGSDQSDLSDDDIDGVCFLYPTESCETAGCPPGHVCTGEGCRPLCGESACGPDEVCRSATCVSSTCDSGCDPGASCSSGADCPRGTDCVETMCLPSPGVTGDPCAGDRECAGGHCSLEGYCTVACTAEGGCPQASTCDSGTGLCSAAAGVFGTTCASSSECASGVCLAAPDGSATCSRACPGPDAYCPGGWVCAPVDGRSVCRPPPVAGGCSVSAGEGSLPWTGLVLLLVWALRGRRRSWSSTRVGLLVLLATIAACGESHVEGETDAGELRDSSSEEPTDGGALLDAIVPPDAVSAGDAAPEPDAGPEPCAEPGMTRVVPCGSCGLASQRCGEDLLWEPPGACLDEGACAPGSVEVEPLPFCGERSRICDASCAWREWTETVPPTGTCDAGETRLDEADCGAGSGREQMCSDACEWVASGPCTDLCGGAPRTTPADAEEICIPAGPFIRGGPRSDAMPQGEVRLSAYYISRYPVTNERYAACVAAGACTAPELLEWHTDPARARHPVQNVYHAQASAFCAWDGGRRLLTEAEWEKAARGPAPREQAYVWGDAYDCDVLYSGFCGFTYATQAIPDPVDGLPSVRSYYGVDMMVGGGFEWTNDYYDEDYYSDPSSYDDPVGPAPGTQRVLRGRPRVEGTSGWGSSGDELFTVYRRRMILATSRPVNGVIRCARTP